MSTISMERIDRIFRRTEFQKETVEKMLHLLAFLDAFSKSPAAKEFALIGGTAIHLGRKEMHRLSEDIDLDYIGNPKLGLDNRQLAIVKKKHEGAIQELATGLRWSFRKGKDKSGPRDSTLYLTSPTNIEIEVNLSYRSCHYVYPPGFLKIPPLYGDRFGSIITINSLHRNELWASKLVACIQDKPPKSITWVREPNPKVKARHIYDTYWLSENLKREVNLNRLRKCLILIGVSRIKRFGWYRGEVIQNFNPQDVKQQVLPMLRMTQRVLPLPDVAWKVRRFLDQSIYAQITEQEYDFMNAWDGGKFLPHTLFPQDKYPGVAARLEKTAFYNEALGKMVGR